MKRILKIVFLIITLLILLMAGYYIYQLYVVPKLTILDVPTLSYPRQSVFYRYYIQSNGLTVTFGGQNMPASQVTTELEKDMKNIKSSGFDGVKLSYSFQGNNYLADRIALRASQQGLYPIGMLQGYQAKPKDRAFTSEEMAEWQKFVRDEVSANKNTIYFWEIWNEPSLFKYGSPEEFVQLLKATYPIIKEANPNAKVVVTLSAAGRDNGFEDQVLSLGGGDYFDILSFHPYGANPYLQEDLIKEAIAHEKSLVAKYNNRWPLVISEIGQPASEVSEEEQARLATFLYAEAAKNKIPVTWFYWSDERLPKDEMTGDGANWGLIRFDGTERTILEAISITAQGSIKPTQIVTLRERSLRPKGLHLRKTEILRTRKSAGCSHRPDVLRENDMVTELL